MNFELRSDIFMASFGGAEFVEAYVMSKLHKEKMEKLRQQEIESTDGPSTMKKMNQNPTNKSSGGFFGTMRNKVHPKWPES